MTGIGARTGAEANAGSELLLHEAQQNSGSRDQSKIEKAGKDFESILLGSWLQGAEESFAAAPGGNEDEEDSGKSQFMGMAMQQLAGTLAGGGGIGIGKMIVQHLQAAAGNVPEVERN